MPQASEVILNEIDQTFAPSVVAVGISGLVGKFKRGPINDATTIINSWAQFLKLFGGFVTGKEDAILAKRAFDRGTTLRIVNVGHYTNIDDGTTLDAVKSTPATSRLLVGSANLVTLNVITVTLNTSNTVAITFTTSSDNTWNLLAAAIVAQFPNLVARAVYMGSNKLILVPATGVTLTASAAVTLGASQATITSTGVSGFLSTATPAFTLAVKYPGLDYNNLIFTISPASNGDANSFNLAVEHLLEPSLAELYTNLKIPGNPTVGNSNYLSAVTNGSQLVNVTYLDLSGTTGQQRPNNTSIKLDTGTDGSTPVDADYVGSGVSLTGFHAFDGIGDMFEIGAVPSSAAVLSGGALYADNRKDLVFYGHLSQTYKTAANYVAAKDALGINTSYAAIFAGSLNIVDPLTGLPRIVSELGDILGASGYSNAKYGPWYSFAGTNRGLIFNALGIVNNFGLDSQYLDRNLMANHQINIVADVDNKLQIMGNFTLQLANSQLSFLNVRKMVIYLKKALGPILKSFIEEPNDLKTWKNIYQTCTPILIDLVKKRAIYDWDWQGDQFAPSITKLNINNPADVQAGKYLVKLFIKAINSLQIIEVDITLSPSGVSFDDNLSSLTQTAA